jgi:ankyrin repeat protein
MRAALVGAMDVTELLLAAGCDRELTDNTGVTAAGYAYKHGTTTYLQYLAQKMIH